MIAYDPRVCLDFDLGHLGKYKVTEMKSAKFVTGPYLSYEGT